MQKESKLTSMIKKMHPMTLICILCAVVFVVYAILYPPTSSETVTDGQTIEARTAIVYRISDGEIKIHRDGKYIEIYEGMRLQAGDVIITKDDSSVYLRVNDDTNVMINEDSRLNISELSNGKLYMEMVKGECYIYAENGQTGDGDYFYVNGSTAMTIRDSDLIEK